MTDVPSSTQTMVLAEITGTPSYSNSIKLNSFVMHSWQLVYINGAGTASIQYSNDGINFATDTESQSGTFSGSDHYVWLPPRTGAAYARLVFNSCTGMSGTIYVNYKEVS